MPLFRRFEIPWEKMPAAQGLEGTRRDPAGSLRLRWLGTAGYELTVGKTTLLLDPFVSRPGLLRLLSGRALYSDLSEGRRYYPKADYVLTGHSHYDHLLDVPEIALRTGAAVAGSQSTCALAKARGVPEARVREVPASGAKLKLGDFEVRFVPSLHGRFLLGREPLPGEITHCDHGGHLSARGYRVGGTFGIWMKAGDLTVYHNGSADLIDAELEGLRADVLILGLAGRFATRDYVERLCRLLRPRWIVPTHYDAFFEPLSKGLSLLPGIDLRGFFRQAARFAPGAPVVMPPYEDVAAFPLGGFR